ncbi:DUF2971 domain-containing protein [Pseudoalteromonas arctica]|uniref:DUF2971 domain-containing protein n=1 Tax=Pseudoalteromonas arctica A 37-1-2 TaxID=1117313 RepID=A0A290S1Y8_9GAMM|nr:DUF2971 domain-containing protein [Pseudoalteromonas arctica]ATC85919.1 hypothetical protein PARC_a1283 [Pseudoalteromonas arctica A 37-1-2]
MEVPSILYKYATASTTNIVLETGRLRWQSPCQFNDIHELQRMPVLSPSFEEGKDTYANKLVDIIFNEQEIDFSKYSFWTEVLLTQLKELKSNNVTAKEALSLLQKHIPSSQDKLEDLFRKSTEQANDGSLRCFCLTENNNNSLMWAHYGDSYAGCMLGFKHIDKLSTPFAAAEKVNYSPNAPIIGSAVDFYLYGHNLEQNKKTRLAIYHTKSEDWAYEKEWRVVYNIKSPSNQRYSDFKFYPEELESITFGPKINPDEKINILKLIENKYSHCKIYEIKINNGQSVRQLVQG